MSSSRRKRAGGLPFIRREGYVRAAMVGAIVAALAGAMVGCGDTQTPDNRRRDVGESGERRVASPPASDTASLLTPRRVDSLVGSARGAGGVATLRSTCATCHDGAHDAQLGRTAEVSSTCVACHASTHEPIQAFYAGLVNRIAVSPDTMFLARVSCVGCHTDSTFAAPVGATRLAALDGMCVSCHGRRFSGMVATWRDGLAWREQAVSAYVGQASADSRLTGEPARSRVRMARQAMELLRTAGALHNVHGADKLFRAAVDSTASAYARAGVAAPARPTLGPDPSRNVCLGCHYGVEASRTTIFGETFDHASHVVRGGVECTACHSDATYFVGSERAGPSVTKDVDARHGRTRLTASACASCHHSAATPLPCTTCHTGDERIRRTIRVTMALKLRPENAPRSRAVDFAHSQHSATPCASCHTSPAAVRTVVSCATCHTDHHRERAIGCTACHGTRMLATHARDSHLKCASCHERATFTTLLPDRTFCASCHVKQETHEPGRECSPCHLRLTPTDVRRRILAADGRAGPGE